MDDNIQITEENREEVLEQVYDNPVFNGEVEDWDSFIRHKVVRDAYADMKNPDAVVKAFSFYPPTSQPMETTQVPAFYLDHNQFLDWDDWEGEDDDRDDPPLDAEGPLVLAADGFKLRTKSSSDYRKVRTVTKDPGELDISDEVDGALTEGHVMLEGVEARRNILTDEVLVTILPDTEVRVVDHDGEVPNSGIREHIDRCLTPRTWGDARYTVPMSTGDSQVFAVGTIGAEEEIDFPYGTEEIVETICWDEENLKYKLKIPTDLISETFGLGDDPDIGEIQRHITGEPVAAYGQFGAGWDLLVAESDEFENEATIDDDDVTQALTEIQQYVENGWMVEHDTTDDGEPLLAIDYEDEVEEDEHGNLIPHAENIAGYDAYDVKQVVKEGEVVWAITVLGADEESQPYIHARENHFTYKRDIPSMGVEKGDRGVTNEGAFIIFLNHAGDGTRLRDDDPFAGKFDDLPVPEDLEADEDEDDGDVVETDSILR